MYYHQKHSELFTKTVNFNQFEKKKNVMWFNEPIIYYFTTTEGEKGQQIYDHDKRKQNIKLLLQLQCKCSFCQILPF